MTMVMPLGVMSTAEGPAYALMSLGLDGELDLQIGTSWAASAEAFAQRLTGKIQCDPALTTVGRRYGWSVVAPDEEMLITRAVVALSTYHEFPPDWFDDVAALVAAWRAFYPMRLWEQLPAEMGLPLLRTNSRGAHEHLVAVLGQAQQEFGVAVYENPADFDQLWSGGSPTGSMNSVLAEEHDELVTTAFRPFGVPAPVVTTAQGLHVRVTTLDDLRLVTGAMSLLTGVVTGVVRVQLATGDELEFVREEKKPAKRPKSKSKPKPKLKVSGARAKPITSAKAKKAKK